MPNLFQRIGASLKAAAQTFGMRFPRGQRSWAWGAIGQSRFAREVGDGSGSSIVEPTLKWIGKNFSEAKPRVRRPSAKAQLEPVRNHPLPALLRRPNPYYSGITLWGATLADWKVSGNGYWRKIRAADRNGVRGRVVQLWWLPSWTVTPMFPEDDPNVYISHYDYAIGHYEPEHIDPSDIVHFRNGLDPNNTRLGKSDLACVLSEIFTDQEATRYTAALLKNMGVPGLVIAPSSAEDSIQPGSEDAEKVKTEIRQRFTGDHRGEPLVMTTPTSVTTIGWNPQQMNLKDLHRLPEERVTAALGVAAIVAGMGAGLERSTFANFKEAREAATEGELVPDWRFFAEEIQFQLLPEFDDPGKAEFDFDLSEVRTLQEDQNSLVERINKKYLAGRITLNESRTAEGLESVGPQGDIYAVPINVTLTPLDQLGVAPEPVAPVADPNAPPPPAKMLDWPEYRIETKGADGGVAAVARLRANLALTTQRDVQRFLTAQQGRVLDSLQPTKAALTMDWEAEDRALTTVLNRSYLRALDGTTELARGYLQAEIDVPDSTVQAFLRASGQHISDINHTTRAAIQKTLAEGNALDESVEELAARIQQLTQFNVARAETIALTELGSSQALAAAYATSLAGLDSMQINDPDGSDGAFTGCTGRHGKIISVDEAFETTLAHPRCRMILVPVVRAPKSNGNGHGAKELVGV